METKAGVFLCNCGGAIKNIDFDVAAKEVAQLPGVSYVKLESNLCSEAGRQEMVASIRNEKIERVVVAGCSPVLREHVFQETVEEAGLNRYLLSMADIREQCSWVHDGDVTAKAVDLVKMAVSRVRLLQAVERRQTAVKREVLVVGGGFAAIATALQLSRFGLPITLLESASTLGTGTGELGTPYGVETIPMIAAVEADRNIKVLTSAQVIGAEGGIGGFSVRVSRAGQEALHKYGAIVLATGYQTELALTPQQEQGVNIVSQEQFSGMLGNASLETRPKTIGFILDFSDENSRFPALATLTNALSAKKKWGSEIYVFCKSVKVDSEGMERLYQRARDCGVVFSKCETPPRVSADNGRVKVEARDVFVGEDIVLACDVLVAEELCLPAEGTEGFSSLLNVRRDSKGFYQDENVHLYPVASEKKGIFFVGGCRGDLDLGRILADISSVTMSVSGLLSLGKVPVDFERVKADPQKCVACLTCIRVCPHGAIQLVRVDTSKEVAQISDLACDACGVCAAICPAKAIRFQGYRDEEILAQIEALRQS
jgi:heterodisulfide reductase subunit A